MNEENSSNLDNNQGADKTGENQGDKFNTDGNIDDSFMNDGKLGENQGSNFEEDKNIGAKFNDKMANGQLNNNNIEVKWIIVNLMMLQVLVFLMMDFRMAPQRIYGQ